MRYILSIIGTLLLGLTLSYGQNIPTIHNEQIESSSEYQEGNDFQKDLLLYIDMLTNTHPYYADAGHRAKLERHARKMYKECEKITDADKFKVYLATIAASLNDGHTAISYWSKLDRIFPVRLALDGDAPAIIDVTSKEQSELLGKEVVGINGKPLKQILRMARTIVSADNDVNFENMVKEYMMFTEFWALMGMNDDVLLLTLADGSNREIPAINKSELQIAQLQKSVEGRVTAQRGVLFDYTLYEDESICYMQFNQFADRLTHPQYPQLARFDEFTHDMMVEINEKGIKTLVVDLQYNSGGNSMLGDVLLSWLYPHKDTKQYGADVRVSELLCAHYPQYREYTIDGNPLEIGKIYDCMSFDQNKEYKIDYSAPQDPAKCVFNFDNDKIFKGNVIFIQGKDSFSSATLLLTLARDNGIGIIVGETSGGRPSHYGDILYCTLPNTGTIATVSHKHFVRPNRKQVADEYLVPDVVIDLNNPDKDLVWEWIINNYGANRSAQTRQKSDDDSYLWDTIYRPSMDN